MAIALAVCCSAYAAGQEDQVDWEKRRASLGHQDKLRVLVDKVLSSSNNWIMTEQHMDEICAAGFNVIIPREGGSDLGRVRRVGGELLIMRRSASKRPLVLFSTSVEEG